MMICDNCCKNENYQVNRKIEMKNLLYFIFTLTLLITAGCDEFKEPEIYPEKKIYVSDLDYLIKRAPIFEHTINCSFTEWKVRVLSSFPVPSPNDFNYYMAGIAFFPPEHIKELKENYEWKEYHGRIEAFPPEYAELEYSQWQAIEFSKLCYDRPMDGLILLSEENNMIYFHLQRY